ncbi:DUF4249 family protein [Mucilaginibacter sp. CAU 1740]|uniref:DUF4249 family protein n=1 Tax=Mucilaginibacter sp. CAU 1740 TaxID=3140365 RepID=UPI00325BE8AD
MNSRENGDSVLEFIDIKSSFDSYLQFIILQFNLALHNMILFKDRKTLSTKLHFHTLKKKSIPPDFTSFGFTISNVLVWLVIISGCFEAGCKKPYTPAIINSDNSYLVVEGVINSGNDSTIISLSKTVKIADTARVNPVNGYTVTVESEGGMRCITLNP